MNRRLLIILTLGILSALLALAACKEGDAYPWENAIRKGGAPAKVAVLPFVGRMDTELMIERAAARFFVLHQTAVTPLVTYIRLPRVAEKLAFPEDTVPPEQLRDIENRIFFDDAKAELYDILDKTGHAYAIYIQADTGVGSAQYIVSVFDARARRNTSESRDGLSLSSSFSEQDIVRAIERCFAQLAR